MRLTGMTGVQIAERIEAAIETGRQLLDAPIDSDADLAECQRERSLWDDLAEATLKKAFGDDADPVAVYGRVLRPPRRSRIYDPANPPAPPTLADKTKKFRALVRARVDKLESIKGQLPLYDEPAPIEDPTQPAAMNPAFTIGNNYAPITTQVGGTGNTQTVTSGDVVVNDLDAFITALRRALDTAGQDLGDEDREAITGRLEDLDEERGEQQPSWKRIGRWVLATVRVLRHLDPDGPWQDALESGEIVLQHFPELGP